MLRLSQKQLEAMSQRIRSDFKRRISLRLREVFTSKVAALDDTALDIFVDQGIVAASQHEICRECDVERFIYLMAVLGQDFDKRIPWIREILMFKCLSPERRMRLLYTTVRQSRKG